MAPIAREKRSTSTSSGSLVRLLFVDDDAHVRRAFVRAASQEGFLVDVAETSREALELFARGAHPLVVTDLSMPQGSGVDLLREIVQRNPYTVCIVVTGVAAPNLPADVSIRDRIISVVAKPWDSDELASALQRALRAWKWRASHTGAVEASSPRRELLVVDDSDSDGELVRAYLSDQPHWNVTRVADIKGALDQLQQRSFEAVITDLSLPDARGIDAVMRIRSVDQRVPLVVLSGIDDEATAVEALKAGAQDLLHKSKLDAATLMRSLRNAREQANRESELRRQANEDALTGLANRARFHERLVETAARAERASSSFGLMYLDLDGFKGVNDQLGHAAGDALLAEVARRIQTTVRETDFPARLGGDEFAIIMEDVVSPENARRAAERMLCAIAQPYGAQACQANVTASIGVALYDRADSVQALTQSADAAMYRAKERGRNRFELSLSTGLAAEATLVDELKDALAQRQFSLHYQAQVDVLGAVHAYEALLRWKRAGGRISTPAEFLPLLEASGDIEHVGACVVRDACHQLKDWQELGGSWRVAVNVSLRQLRGNGLIDSVERALDETGVAPESLELEFTESMFLDDEEHSVRVLRSLKELGVRLALDDFGTSSASLSRLSRLPFDVLKIDGTLATDLLTQESARAATRAIIAAGHALGLAVVAEGVETEAQRDHLLHEGCDLLQGFLFGSPELPAAISAKLEPTDSLILARGEPLQPLGARST